MHDRCIDGLRKYLLQQAGNDCLLASLKRIIIGLPIGGFAGW